MATAPLNIDTKRLPTTPQWSPILSHSSLSSPRSASTSTDDLSLRCRKLARSFGEHSILDDAHFEPQSPSRSRENSQETSSSSSPLPPPASPLSRHSHHLPLSPPTPEGSHVLNEILEEENESTAATPNEELESEKGLGFENSQGGEAMQFKMSPCLGGQMSLHGASLALENDGQREGGGGGLELSLHDQMKMDNEETFSSAEVDHEQVLKEELKNGKDWIKIDVSLVDDELLIGSPQSRLDPSRTFSTCYVDPLLRMLSSAAPSSPAPFFSPHHRRFSSSSSLLSPSPSSTELTPSNVPTSSHPIHLHLTLHTPLQITLQYLLASLQPLHDEHYLVSYCSNARLTSKAPVMVLIESGEVEGEEMDRELERLGHPRIIYREVKLDEVSSGKVNDQSHPIVGIDYKTMDGGEAGLKKEVERLHEKGFSVKVGGLPRFPEHERKLIELNLKDTKVDYVF